MNNRKLEYRLMIGVFIFVMVLYFLLQIFDPKGKTHLQKDSKVEGFQDKYLIELRTDSFISALQKKYQKDIIISFAKKLKIELKNQGASTSNFYNDNQKLLETKSFGFDMAKIDNNTIIANFDTTNVKGMSFVKVPSDVLYGIFSN